jgi:subtilase family serine protease
VPDVALNADPYTGYSLVSSTDPGPGLTYNGGGTSFVAPQLNGISALLEQSVGGRVGLWNPQIYAMQLVYGYGPNSPFNDITAGDNWYFAGHSGYDQGSGLGSLNVANMAAAFRLEFYLFSP